MSNYLVPTVSCGKCWREYTAHSRPVFYMNDRGPTIGPSDASMLATSADFEDVFSLIESQARAEADWEKSAGSAGIICPKCVEREEWPDLTSDERETITALLIALRRSV